jgi:hypothetical protein
LVPVWLLVAAKAEALTERATRAAMATIMDFFMVDLLFEVEVKVKVKVEECLLHAGAGFDLGLGPGAALGLGARFQSDLVGGEGGGADGEGDEGGDSYYHDARFH